MCDDNLHLIKNVEDDLKELQLQVDKMEERLDELIEVVERIMKGLGIEPEKK